VSERRTPASLAMPGARGAARGILRAREGTKVIARELLAEEARA
jgi:hypothetical protein